VLRGSWAAPPTSRFREADGWEEEAWVGGEGAVVADGVPATGVGVGEREQEQEREHDIPLRGCCMCIRAHSPLRK
jgi:hypothetical protein